MPKLQSKVLMGLSCFWEGGKKEAAAAARVSHLQLRLRPLQDSTFNIWSRSHARVQQIQILCYALRAKAYIQERTQVRKCIHTLRLVVRIKPRRRI